MANIEQKDHHSRICDTGEMSRVSVKKVRGKRFQRSGRYKVKAPWRRIQRYQGTMTKLNPQKGIYGFPRELVTKVRYCETYTLTSTASSIAKQAFRMNSIFDPDYTGSGHQPMYFDTLATLYGRYVVLGAKLTVQFTQVPSPIANAQPSGPVTVGVVSSYDATLDTLLSTLEEQPNGDSATLLPDGNGEKIMTLTYSPEKDLGIDNSDDTVGAAFTTNPSETWYGWIYACETNGSTAVSVNAKVTIEFTVRCKKLIDIAGS